jgi:hypothetical protein
MKSKHKPLSHSSKTFSLFRNSEIDLYFFLNALPYDLLLISLLSLIIHILHPKYFDFPSYHTPQVMFLPLRWLFIDAVNIKTIGIAQVLLSKVVKFI